MESANLTENGTCLKAETMVEDRSSLLFLGTGCSSAIPNAMCLIQPSNPPCQVCSQALSVPPEHNPNYRCNTSLLIDYFHGDGEHKYILIDVGKTFREQVLRWFTHHKIPHVDSQPKYSAGESGSWSFESKWIQRCYPGKSVTNLFVKLAFWNCPLSHLLGKEPLKVQAKCMSWAKITADISLDVSQRIILTHEHADAVLGLDDIRAIQPFSPTNDIEPTPIHLTQFAMDSIAIKFPYLAVKKLKEGQEVRRVAQLDWKIIKSDFEEPFVSSGLRFVPLPVMHGEDYICLGFLFGEKSKVAYISDISRFPESTEYVISKNGGGQLDLLILDTLYKTGSHNTHFCLPQTLDAVKRICPKQALLIGMTHEFDHQKDNLALMEWSRREGIPVQLAHDGLRIQIDL